MLIMSAKDKKSDVFRYFEKNRGEPLASSSFESHLQTTAWPHWITGQVLSSHSIASSSRTVRHCSLLGGLWIGHWKTTWSTFFLLEHKHRPQRRQYTICASSSGSAKEASKSWSVRHPYGGD